MKKITLMLMIVVLGLGFAGCDNGSRITIDEIDVGIIVTISRSVMFLDDPVLVVVCDEASMDYEKQIIFIKGLRNLSGRNCYEGFLSSWVLKEIKWTTTGMEIQIPDDADYDINIGGRQYRILKK
ncbi:MAG: hypothetical protein WAV31_04700 [Candidatus Moraniibacteriota bacterium]